MTTLGRWTLHTKVFPSGRGQVWACCDHATMPECYHEHTEYQILFPWRSPVWAFSVTTPRWWQWRTFTMSEAVHRGVSWAMEHHARDIAAAQAQQWANELTQEVATIVADTAEASRE